MTGAALLLVGLIRWIYFEPTSEAVDAAETGPVFVGFGVVATAAAAVGIVLWARKSRRMSDDEHW
jgi:hypothetical protein